MVRIQHESYGWRKSEWIYLIKVFVKNHGAGVVRGSVTGLRLKTPVWARRSTDEGNLGQRERNLETHGLLSGGGRKVVVVVFKSVRSSNGCARSSVRAPVFKWMC